jgi:hypothetical protein
MKHLIWLIFIISFNSSADLDATFGTGAAMQIYTGQQPNDEITKYVKLNISIVVTSNYDGIQAAAGYEFVCTGDSFPNRKHEVDSTSDKALSIIFSSDSPLYYDSWSSAPVDTRTCNLSWSASAVGTMTSNGTAIGFTLSGAFASIMLNFTSSSTPPEYRKARAANSIFTMYKEPECRG